MTTLKRPASRSLAIGLTLALATVVAAQGFVWPPAAGDRVAQAESGRAENQAIEPAQFDRPPAENRPAEEPLSYPVRPTTVAAGQPAPAALAPLGGGQTQWKILENPNGPHAALIFDPVRQVFAVYHVDAASGQIMLKSVRNLSADLRLEQFNSGAPAPKDIQAMIDESRERR